MVVLKSTPSPLSALVWSLFCLLLFGGGTQAQKTDPVEVKALNSIFSGWGITAPSSWNISGEPCSGAATDATSFDNTDFNPFIKCDCSYNSNTTCHITQLKVYAMSVVGTIPEELMNLTYLFNLDLRQNYLTGPLPGFIGNFTFMQYLSVGINALSGPIPMELGNLQQLVVLGIGSNNFSGVLPSELGNLTNLQQLYIDSAGVSGMLPSSLAKLQNLETVWASDNAFTGNIPEFIGTWKKLTSLRFQGNSFRGPIPSSFSNLIQLTDLRIGDIINGSSSLAFIQNTTSLSTLILRNCKISDTISSDFGRYSNLGFLDLSFNNLTGQLPESLFNLSLTYLFLGNNSLSGSLPSVKSTSLLNIDLSYNKLSGSFPSWVSQQNLQINMVANNFVIDNSNSSSLPSGSNCLQQDFPCNLGSPVYYSFAVNCGGSKSITSSDGTVYEADNQNLSAASYYVTDTTRWAVSNAGRFADASTLNYIQYSLSQFTNTLDSELFQTARMSPSSLRYYGLGLENGYYNVKLQFAETAFPNTRTWQSLGRRIFDIYIQGSRVEKDFDIRKESGGTSFRAVSKGYVAPVTQNVLEIHFFWAGKGTCCIPTQGYYGPLISAISASPFNFTPIVSNQPPNTGSNNNSTGLIAGLVAGISALCFSIVVGIFIWRARRKRLDLGDDEALLGLTSRPDTFSYAQLRTATNDFSVANKLGEGGFGPVFKGKLSDGRSVAVKQLSIASNQGKLQFMAEIATISAVQHRNLVKLYGCCIEGEKRLLVYEYLENKSLDQALFGKSKLHLDWSTRFAICLNTARGLAYLHEESRIRIVHRDVKASNILLDADLNPKISDFGLAKLYDDKKTHISTRVAGTIGYLAPEYAMRGHLTEKADVFGFGVVALEILSGRPNSDTTLDTEQAYLLEWAWHLHETRRELEMVDQTLSSYNEEEAVRLIGVSLLCTQASPMLRPPMSRVVAMLSGDTEVGEVKSKPGYLTDWQFCDLTNNFLSSDISGPSTATTASVNLSSTGSSAIGAVYTPTTSQSMTQDALGEGR